MTPGNFLRVMLALSALLLTAQVGAAGPVRDALRERRAQADALDDGAGDARSVSLPEGVKRLADLAYGSDPAQRLDVYLPREAKAAPLLVLVHGGGWSRGDKGNQPSPGP